MNIKIKIFVFFLFLVFIVYTATGGGFIHSTKKGSSYIYENWTIAKGLPQNSVFSLIQSKNGYIWFGTKAGIVRFDGVKFRIFSKWNVDKLQNNHIKSIVEDDNGGLWIGTYGGGVLKYRNDKWVLYSKKDNLNSEYINALFIDEKSKIWVGTDFGMNFIDGSKVLDVNELKDLSITCFSSGLNGNFYAGTESGSIFKINQNKKKILEKFKISNSCINSLELDKKGRLWIGSENGLYYLDKNGINEFLKIEKVKNKAISILNIDGNNMLWFGTDGEGIYKVDLNNTKDINRLGMIESRFITSIMEDKEGSYWVGTYTSGLFRIKDRIVDMIDVDILNNIIFSLYYDDNEFLWAGTRDKGLCKIDNSGSLIKRISKFGGFYDINVRALYKDNRGNIWIGTENQGINIYFNGIVKRITQKSKLYSNTIKSIIKDKNNRIWVGTNKGLNYIENNTVYEIKQSKGININKILEKKNGIILIGSEKGLYVCLEDKLKLLLKEKWYKNMNVLSIYEDNNNDIWIGTNGRGVVFYNGKNSVNITREQGISSNVIYSIIEGEKNKLWFGSLNGIFTVKKNDFKKLFDNKVKKVNSILFTESDGMNNRECTGNVQPSVVKDKNGVLYFPTVKGIACIDSKKFVINNIPPETLIERVIIENKPYSVRKTHKLPPGKKMIEFYFTGLSFISPEKMRFKYKLEGFDKDWKETYSRLNRSAIYLNIRPGKYNFKVKASNNHGIWDKSYASFNFVIKNYFYKSIYFYLLLLIVSGIFGGLLYQYNNYIKKNKLKNKYGTSTLTSDIVDETLPKLMEKIEKDKVYLDPNLTLQKLSQELNIHRNHLSQIVNVEFNMKFKDFLNKYRIEEAKKLLVSPDYERETILNVAYDSGFNSKSVFNTAFKKFTGKTPSKYRKEDR